MDSAATTIFQTGLWATLGCSLAAPFVWVAPGVRGLGADGVARAARRGGHYLLVLAYERAPASTLAPLAYSSLLWSVLIGVLLFGELPDTADGGRAAVIAAGGLLALSAAGRPRPGTVGATGVPIARCA